MNQFHFHFPTFGSNPSLCSEEIWKVHMGDELREEKKYVMHMITNVKMKY